MMSQCLGSVNEPEGPLIWLKKPRDLVANPLKSHEFLALTGSTETWSLGATTKVLAHLASGPPPRASKRRSPPERHSRAYELLDRSDRILRQLDLPLTT